MVRHKNRLKKRCKEIVSEVHRMPAIRRAILQVLCIIIIKDQGKISSRSLADKIKRSMDKLYDHKMTEHDITSFIAWEKEAVHGIIAGPKSCPTMETWLRKDNINGDAGFLIKLVEPRIKDEIMSILGFDTL